MKQRDNSYYSKKNNNQTGYRSNTRTRGGSEIFGAQQNERQNDRVQPSNDRQYHGDRNFNHHDRSQDRNQERYQDRNGYQDKRRGQQGRQPQNRRQQEKIPAHVAELRALMSEQGVLVCTFLVDRETKALLHAVHLESRGLMLPHDGKALHAQIVSSCREFYEIALKDIPDIEPKDLNRLLKQDAEKLLREILGRVPCVIVLIHFL